MPRRRTGSIREVTLSDGRVAYRGRFTDQGGRRREIKLGHSPLISRAEAEQALKHWLADVDRGTWKPPAPPQPAPQEEPETFDDFVHSDWLPSRGIEIEEGGKVIAQPGQELSEGTQRNIVWSLRCHLLPFFGEDPLAAITPQRIDDWRAWALKSQGPLPHDGESAPRPAGQRLGLSRRLWTHRGESRSRPAAPRQGSQAADTEKLARLRSTDGAA